MSKCRSDFWDDDSTACDKYIAELEAKVSTLTAERDEARRGALLHADHARDNFKRATAAEAREKAEQELANAIAEHEALEAAIDEHLPRYGYEDGTDDEANAIERIEYAGDALKKAEAELAEVTAERDALQREFDWTCRELKLEEERRAAAEAREKALREEMRRAHDVICAAKCPSTRRGDAAWEHGRDCVRVALALNRCQCGGSFMTAFDSEGEYHACGKCGAMTRAALAPPAAGVPPKHPEPNCDGMGAWYECRRCEPDLTDEERKAWRTLDRPRNVAPPEPKCDHSRYVGACPVCGKPVMQQLDELAAPSPPEPVEKRCTGEKRMEQHGHVMMENVYHFGPCPKCGLE